MSDIMKAIRYPQKSGSNLLELEEWSEEQAKQTAAELRIELTPAHWRVIHFLRRHYAEHNDHSLKALLQGLEEEFKSQGGRRYLYQLLPGGPISQGCLLAGIPTPEHTEDPAFGIIH